MWLDQYYGGVPYGADIPLRKIAKRQNDYEYINTFNNLYTQALDTFAYDNLPESCDQRMIERSFLNKGMCLLAKEGDSYLSLATAPGSGLNVYGYPTKAFGYGMNGFNKEYNLYIPGASLTDEVIKAMGGTASRDFDAVLGYDNAMRFPYINYIFVEALRLTKLMRSMDVAVDNLKLPIIINADDRQIPTIKQALSQRDENLPVLVSNGKVPLEDFKVWDTKVSPDSLTAMRDQYEWVQSKVYTILGIDNLQAPDKRERLISGEAEANEEQVAVSVEKRLAWRKKWCEEINDAFGLNVSVHLKTDDIKEKIRDEDLERMGQFMKGGEENVGEAQE